MKTDYEKEFDTIQTSNSDVFKPALGCYDILVDSEAQPCEYINLDGDITPQIKLNIKIDDQLKLWFISKAKTTASLYGQLMALGKYNGTLKGLRLTLIVNSTILKNGKERKVYTIPEAVRLIDNKKAKAINI